VWFPSDPNSILLNMVFSDGCEIDRKRSEESKVDSESTFSIIYDNS
jgi:hypothetical protein